jgi:hypothetical protein
MQGPSGASARAQVARAVEAWLFADTSAASTSVVDAAAKVLDCFPTAERDALRADWWRRAVDKLVGDDCRLALDLVAALVELLAVSPTALEAHDPSPVRRDRIPSGAGNLHPNTRRIGSQRPRRRHAEAATPTARPACWWLWLCWG